MSSAVPYTPRRSRRVPLVHNIILLFNFIYSRLNVFINAAIVAVCFFILHNIIPETYSNRVATIQFLLRQSSYNFCKNKAPIIFSLPLRVNHRVCILICYIMLYNTALFSAFFFFAERVYTA